MCNFHKNTPITRRPNLVLTKNLPITLTTYYWTTIHTYEFLKESSLYAKLEINFYRTTFRSYGKAHKNSWKQNMF